MSSSLSRFSLLIFIQNDSQFQLSMHGSQHTVILKWERRKKKRREGGEMKETNGGKALDFQLLALFHLPSTPSISTSTSTSSLELLSTSSLEPLSSFS